MKFNIRKRYFTLIELMAAMGVFSIIMLIMITLFSSAQNIWNLTRQKNTMYENARIALDLIARDIQCIYYEQEKIPFYHHPGDPVNNDSDPTNNNNDTEALYFISATNCLPSYNCNTRLCEIAYKFYNMDDPPPPAEPTNARAGWLVRSVTGDQEGINTNWNYYAKPAEKVAAEAIPLGRIYDNTDDTYAFTRDSFNAGLKCSRDVFNTVIPYVTNLTFTCFKKDGTVIDTTSASNKKMFPYSIMIELTLLDRESWLKWKATGFADTSPILNNNRRTFSRTVLIGERGQKY